MPEKKHNWWKIGSFLILLVVLANVLVLDYLVGSRRGREDVDFRLDALEERVARLSETLATLTFEEATRSGTSSATESVPIPTGEPPIVTRETVVEKVVQAPAQQVKEFYVPLGQASVRTENFTWQDTGAEASLDLGNYPGVKEVRFEATLSVESGQVEARLYNVSDGYGLVESTLVAHGPTPKLYRSASLTLPQGSKTYRVQMRTALPYTGIMDNGRIRILVE